MYADSQSSVPLRNFNNIAQSVVVESEWPDLLLFIPVFPGGEREMNHVLLRSMKLFWPKKDLKILFLVDEELPPETRDPFVERIKRSMEKDAKSVEVKLNSIPQVYKGHDRQQLIMFWADNFTNAEFVGFLDDDTLITNHVLLTDVFDEKGRPHVWGRSNTGTLEFWKRIAETTRWTDNSDVEVMRTMNYFPVVVKTSHLKEIRTNILKYHPEHGNFDNFFSHIIKEKGRHYSQFNIMHQHLWKMKRDDYNWHLQATSTKDDHFKQIIGVTDQMTFPKPRCALHFSYDYRRERPYFVKDVLKRGFCYSLSKEEFDSKNGHANLCIKARYTWGTVSTTPNIDQWRFERLDWRWDNRSVEAHKKRISLNRARTDWNEEQIKLIFR